MQGYIREANIVWEDRLAERRREREAVPLKAATKRAPFRYTVGEMVPDVYDSVESRVIAEARSFMDASNICFALNAREEGR